MTIGLGPPTEAVARVGIRAELMARTQAQLQGVHGELAKMTPFDLDRHALMEREGELTQLLEDLEQGVLSSAVLLAAARLRR